MLTICQVSHQLHRYIDSVDLAAAHETETGPCRAAWGATVRQKGLALHQDEAGMNKFCMARPRRADAHQSGKGLPLPACLKRGSQRSPISPFPLPSLNPKQALTLSLARVRRWPPPTLHRSIVRFFGRPYPVNMYGGSWGCQNNQMHYEHN